MLLPVQTEKPKRPFKIEKDGVSRWREIGEIERPVLPADRKLPPSSDLAKRFDVIRHTVLRAPAHLQAERFVLMERGRGTYAVVNSLQLRWVPSAGYSRIWRRRIGRPPAGSSSCSIFERLRWSLERPAHSQNDELPAAIQGSCRSPQPNLPHRSLSRVRKSGSFRCWEHGSTKEGQREASPRSGR